MHLYPAGIATCDRRITKEDLYVCAKCVFGLKAIFKSQQLPVNGLFCSTFIICMQYHYCNNEPTQIIRQHSPRCPSISLPAEYSEIRSILLSFSWYKKIVFFLVLRSLWPNPGWERSSIYFRVERKFHRTQVKFSHTLRFVKFYDTVEGILSKNGSVLY